MSKPRVAIIGAGPVGVEAALAALDGGLAVAAFERGVVGDHVRRWGHVRMFSPFGHLATPAGLRELRRGDPKIDLPADADHVTGNDFLECYLLPLGETAALRDCLHLETEVLHVGHDGSRFRLLVESDAGERVEEADAVLDCSGVFGTPRWLGAGGVPALGEAAAMEKIAYGPEPALTDRRDEYADRSVIVIGGGYSAATTVCDLAELARAAESTWIIWLVRADRKQPLPRRPDDPLKERVRLAARANNLATRSEGNIEYHPRTVVERVETVDDGFRVHCRVNGGPRVFDGERLIANVGHRADFAFAEALGDVRAVPGYHVLGVKGDPRGFMLRKGYAAAKTVIAGLTGKRKRAA